MKSNYCIYNGTLVPVNSVHIGIDNRSFKYGDGLFETIRVMNGKPLFLIAHFQRLMCGLDALRIEKSELTNLEKLEHLIFELLSVSKISKSARIRLHIWRNGDGFYTPVDYSFSYLMECTAIENKAYALNKKGLHLGFYHSADDCNGIVNVKTASSLKYILAAIYRQEQGLDDVILVNGKNEVVETTNSNVFCIINDEIYTPSLKSGCIDGVLRRQLMNNDKLNIRESILTIEQLLRADEVFITNVISGIQWVECIGDHDFKNKTIKKIKQVLDKQIL